MNDAFTLLCASNVVEAQRVKALLEENNIFPIIKDESESARLAGFGISNIGIQQLFVHESEVPNATKIINVTLGQMKL